MQDHKEPYKPHIDHTAANKRRRGPSKFMTTLYAMVEVSLLARASERRDTLAGVRSGIRHQRRRTIEDTVVDSLSLQQTQQLYQAAVALRI